MLDLTVGAGGHSRALIDVLGPRGFLLGVDRDELALTIAKEVLAGESVELVRGSFGDLAGVARLAEASQFDGILADLGVSSMQLDDATRGFSFRQDGPLDMRMDRSQPISARDYLRTVSLEELTRVIAEFGEERFAGRVANAIDRVRRQKDIETTGELAEIVRHAVPKSRGQDKDPATRTFQAIRIAVNRELEALDHLLGRFGTLLAPGGRFAVISFHSLEDRRVKQVFRERAREGDYELLTRDAIRPGEIEIARNPRARSARLRSLRRKREGER